MTEEAGNRTEALRRRRVPCMIAFLHPFRLVDVDGVAAWKAPIEQINGGWDYVALHRLVGGDVGLEPPYPLVVGRDGALALPHLANLRSVQSAAKSPYFQGGSIARRSTRMASASDQSSTGPTPARTSPSQRG